MRGELLDGFWPLIRQYATKRVRIFALAKGLANEKETKVKLYNAQQGIEERIDGRLHRVQHDIGCLIAEIEELCERTKPRLAEEDYIGRQRLRAALRVADQMREKYGFDPNTLTG